MLTSYFPDTYLASRQRFRSYLPLIESHWPAANLQEFRLPGDEGLTIDHIEAPAVSNPDHLFMLTTGEHGVEGFVGAAVLHLFLEEYLERLRPEDTGIILVHAINPWGMAHFRRVNPQNVDLNRSFRRDGDPAEGANPLYAELDSFLNPNRPIGNLENLHFFGGLLRALTRHGAAGLRQATLLGQYRHPRGIYYGGIESPLETTHAMQLFRQAFTRYQHVVHLDIHTGYGARDQMSVVHSPLEPRPLSDLAHLFGYPHLVKADPEQFYSIEGDMIDYEYHLAQTEFPHLHLYAAAFEFGTYGNSILAGVRSLQAMVMENQLYWHGVRAPRLAKRVQRAFGELFFPSSTAWRRKALADARQAMAGILRGEGLAAS